MNRLWTAHLVHVTNDEASSFFSGHFLSFWTKLAQKGSAVKRFGFGWPWHTAEAMLEMLSILDKN